MSAGLHRVLVVDDSAVMRRLVSEVLSSEPGIEVSGTAADGAHALQLIEELAPDLVTLDVEMPVLDGLSTLTRLRRAHPRLPVVMMSSLTRPGVAVTLDALERGADDFVTKPTGTSLSASRQALTEQLVPVVLALCTRPGHDASRPCPPPSGPAPELTREPGREVEAARPQRPQAVSVGASGVDVVVVGASTGGPEALGQVLSSLPGDLGVPVLVVQHMPPVFTAHLARRIDLRSRIEVIEAAGGETVVPGRAILAPGGRHLTLTGAVASGSRLDTVCTALDDGVPENYCRPSVDVLFRAARRVYGGRVLAVVLTGMGSDGALGAAAIREAGGSVIVQDEASSVVWGMPGATRARVPDCLVRSLDQVPGAIVSVVQGRS